MYSSQLQLQFVIKLISGIRTTKFRGSPNIFLTKYQLSVFLCLLFAEKINLLLVNQQKISQLKLVMRSWKKVKKNWLRKIFVDSRNFGGSVATNELYFSEKKIYLHVFFTYRTCATITRSWLETALKY